MRSVRNATYALAHGTSMWHQLSKWCGHVPYLPVYSIWCTLSGPPVLPVTLWCWKMAQINLVDDVVWSV